MVLGAVSSIYYRTNRNKLRLYSRRYATRDRIIRFEYEFFDQTYCQYMCCRSCYVALRVLSGLYANKR
ncbi:MAG: hypothetical protein K2L17_07275 [Muribaculaceae bacterium]|nr:hypothetical protein [Muribaculaceae bacterium]